MRIEIRTREGFPDFLGLAVKEEISLLGIEVRNVKLYEVYWISGEVDEGELERVFKDYILDPVEKEMKAGGFGEEGITVTYHPGVMDPVALTLKDLLVECGIRVKDVKTGRKYIIEGELSPGELERIKEKVLMNPTIEREVKGDDVFFIPSPYTFKLITVPLLNASDEELIRISKEGMLSLSLEEMRKIKEYYKSLGRDPTDIELETIAQTWSEHCYHKTFKSPIEFEGKVIPGIFYEYIVKATEEVNAPWCLLVFKDNAGAIAFDDEYAVTFKVETHNHPSALEPYGGAGTGIGGVIRDTMGTGLGAKPVANTDVFCFAPLDTPPEKLPPGVLHPRRIARGVVAGVRDYGNRMGIPTVNGSVSFHPGFLGNPLVYCGSVGIIPRKFLKKEVIPGDVIVVVGGRTGRDGIHGATFSSMKLDEQSEKVSGGAVQIGNPIEEKKLLDALLRARDEELYRAITDCGAGGFSSAVGEMGRDCGAEVELSHVPLKYEGLSYTEIWISESQERMVLSVPPEKLERLLEIFREEGVEATPIGKFTDTKKLVVRYKGEKVCELDMDFLHGGVPLTLKRATYRKREIPDGDFDPPPLKEALLSILSSPDVASKEWIVRQYDHEVQGGSVVKPLCGNDGPSDGAIIRPVLSKERGVIIAHGINPSYGEIEPYWMAASVIDEALRNLIACGGRLEGSAILDNFSFGDVNDPYVLGDLVMVCKGCYDFAKLFGVPFISGKDSLHNEFEAEGKKISIPPTLLISSIGILEDLSCALTTNFKRDGTLILVIGETRRELGGSEYFRYLRRKDGLVPRVYPEAKDIMERVSRCTREGLFLSLHDISEGGLGVALCEMGIGGRKGFSAELSCIPATERAKRPDIILFSESNTRWVAEVDERDKGRVEELLSGIPHAWIGRVGGEDAVFLYGGVEVLRLPMDEVERAWKEGIKW